jgi:hypothetical protein
LASHSFLLQPELRTSNQSKKRFSSNMVTILESGWPLAPEPFVLLGHRPVGNRH